MKVTKTEPKCTIVSRPSRKLTVNVNSAQQLQLVRIVLEFLLDLRSMDVFYEYVDSNKVELGLVAFEYGEKYLETRSNVLQGIINKSGFDSVLSPIEYRSYRILELNETVDTTTLTMYKNQIIYVGADVPLISSTSFTIDNPLVIYKPIKLGSAGDECFINRVNDLLALYEFEFD